MLQIWIRTRLSQKKQINIKTFQILKSRLYCTVPRAGDFSCIVLDPWRFDKDLDPDPRIRNPCLRIQLRIRIRTLLFSSVAFNTNKIYIFSPRLLLSVSIKKFERYRNLFLLLMEGSGSVQIIKQIRIQETEKYRLRIWNIASKQYNYEPSLSGAMEGP